MTKSITFRMDDDKLQLLDHLASTWTAIGPT